MDEILGLKYFLNFLPLFTMMAEQDKCRFQAINYVSRRVLLRFKLSNASFTLRCTPTHVSNFFDMLFGSLVVFFLFLDEG